jgi:hypothetical protein
MDVLNTPHLDDVVHNNLLDQVASPLEPENADEIPAFLKNARKRSAIVADLRH